MNNSQLDAIQMVDLQSQYDEIKDEINDSIHEVISSSSYINGPAVKKFSSNLAQWNNSKFVIPCANGTDGLQIAMMALDLEYGDEVIVPAFTYIATVEVIALLGLTPVFVEVNPDTFNIDVEEVKKAITSKTKAIVPVHLYGQSVDMDPIKILSEENDIYIIEDLAQAIGCEYKGKKVGNIGHIGVTSFFPSKNLGCYGDGGALFTNDDALANKIRMITNHGQSRKYYHDIVGVNSRLDTIQAAILDQKLKKLDEYISSRQDVAKIYDIELGQMEQFISIPKRTTYSTHVFHQYTLKLKSNRDELKEFLRERNIPSMIYYPLPIPDQKAYQHYSNKSFPICEELSKQVISLPMHTHLERNQQLYIINSIKEFFA
jgi:UDP-2-acetamido-2-deoxy-ribo-hexuluronate aminotransferase